MGILPAITFKALLGFIKRILIRSILLFILILLFTVSDWSLGLIIQPVHVWNEYIMSVMNTPKIVVLILLIIL